MIKLFLIFSFCLLADDFGGFGHPNKGCPLNSICGKEMGQRKAIWDDFLKNLPKDKKIAANKLDEFRKNNGILIPIWTVSNTLEENDLIKWSSPCPQHQKEDNKFFQAEVFTSDISKLDGKRFVEEVALLLNEDNSILSYKIPNKEVPIYLNGKEMIFTMTSEGYYYHLGVNPSGKLRVFDAKPSDFSPNEVECPKTLINQFNQIKNDLFSGHFCRSVYNSATNKYQTLLFGLTCV